jgi:hypothetical protein
VRYLLVGFVNVERYKRNTWYRRFGMLSQCVRFVQYNATAAAPLRLFRSTAGEPRWTWSGSNPWISPGRFSCVV